MRGTVIEPKRPWDTRSQGEQNFQRLHDPLTLNAVPGVTDQEEVFGSEEALKNSVDNPTNKIKQNGVKNSKKYDMTLKLDDIAALGLIPSYFKLAPENWPIGQYESFNLNDKSFIVEKLNENSFGVLIEDSLILPAPRITQKFPGKTGHSILQQSDGSTLTHDFKGKKYKITRNKDLFHINELNGEVVLDKLTENMINKLFENDMNHNEIMKGLLSHSLEDRKNAIQHPNATPKHIDKALDDVSPHVRVAAIKHPNANHENIEKALTDHHVMVRAAAMNHPNMEKY